MVKNLIKRELISVARRGNSRRRPSDSRGRQRRCRSGRSRRGGYIERLEVIARLEFADELSSVHRRAVVTQWLNTTHNHHNKHQYTQFSHLFSLLSSDSFL